MNESGRLTLVRRSSYRTGAILILGTVVLCVLAIAFRTPIRSRIWASRLAAAETVGERAELLSQLCRAGDAAFWGVTTLLSHDDPEVRQYGVLALQGVRSDWTIKSLRSMADDPHESVRRLARAGLALRTGADESEGVADEENVDPPATAPAR